MLTFSRAARLLALLVVAASLWRARPVQAPSQVAVLLLPGATTDAVAAIPAVYGGPIALPASTSGAAFWRLLLSIEDGPACEPESLVPVWEALPREIRVSRLPSRLFGVDSAATAFVGSSSGARAEYAELTAGRLPSPYDRAIEAVTATAATLGKDVWSDWIRVTPAPAKAGEPAPPEAEFQVARVADSYWLFTPAYVVDHGDASADPFLRGAERGERPLLASHVLGRSRRRMDSIGPVLRTGGEAGPVVMFEDVAEDVASVFAPDSVPSSMQVEVDAFLASTVRAARSAVGPDGVLVVVGGPMTGRTAGSAWCRVMAGEAGDTEAVESGTAGPDLASVRALLLHMLGVQLDGAEKAQLPPEIASRFPIKAKLQRPLRRDVNEAPVVPWTASSLESLPGAVASGS